MLDLADLHITVMVWVKELSIELESFDFKPVKIASCFPYSVIYATPYILIYRYIDLYIQTQLDILDFFYLYFQLCKLSNVFFY